MKLRTARRSQVALAALAPLALAVAAIGTWAASPALATPPSYTITTGTTGSNVPHEDTPAYPFIDSNGTFYLQSSLSYYSPGAPRSWHFWTGRDVDTNLNTATISSSPDNADTTVRCNNSPTGQEATYDPSNAPSQNVARNFCDLVGAWVDPDTGTWYGVVHNEFTLAPFASGLHYDAIDRAQSTDHGLTWTITDHIITSPFPTYRENDQLWTLNLDGSIQVGSKCLDTGGGTAVVGNSCTGGAGQKWTVTGSTLVNPASKLCLTASGTGTGATFTTQACTTSSSATQDFTTPAAGSKGQIKLAAAAAECVLGNPKIPPQLAACNDPAQDGRDAFPNQTWYWGDGDPRLFVDYATGYFYLYYDSNVLDTAGGGKLVLGHVARAPISGKMTRSSWHKWYNGAWTEPGVGGKEAVLTASDGTTSGYLDDVYNPKNTGTITGQQSAGTLPDPATTPLLTRVIVTYDAYLGKYISMPNPSSSTAPVAVYATSDLSTQKWVDIGTVTNPATGHYRSLLDEVDKTSNLLVGKTYRHNCAYDCTGSGTGPEWVDTTIDTAAGNLPAQPVRTGAAYQIAAGDGQYLTQSGSALTTTATTGTAASQSWTFTPTGDGFFTVSNAATGQNIGVDDTGNAGRTWGAPLTLGTATTAGRQWSIQTVNDPTLPATSFRLVNRYSGQALSLTGGTGGAATAPQRDWTNTGTTGDTHPVSAQTLTFFPAGPANLIPAGNFESGNQPGWTTTNAAIVTDPAAHSPTHDLQLKSPAGGTATMEYKVTNLLPNTKYTYSGWVRADTGGTTSFGVKGYGGTQVDVHTTATTWTPESDTFVTGATNTTATIFCYLPTPSATSTCDDLTLTAG